MWQKEVSSYTFLGMGEVSQQEPTARLSDSWAGGREGVWELGMWPLVSLWCKLTPQERALGLGKFAGIHQQRMVLVGCLSVCNMGALL